MPRVSVKCAVCGEQVLVSERVGEVGNWKHPACQKMQEDKEKLMVYIVNLFGLHGEHDGAAIQTNRRLVTTYIKQKNYTCIGIKQALDYFYNVQKNSKEKSNNRIGIVPFVYDEAVEHFRRMSEKKQKVIDSSDNYTKKIEHIITIKDRSESNKKEPLYNLNEIE